MKIKAKVKKNKLKLFDEGNRRIDSFNLENKENSKTLLEGLSLKYGISKGKTNKKAKRR